ncbi:MAG TPA: cyclase family protein [Ramlibacter sp.]|nr:cyclase family protein [Ramlibacter sp.]
MPEIPLYADLPTIDGERHAWGVFGPDDEFGCLNFLNPAAVSNAARLVETGKVISLDVPLGEPQPQFWAMRPPLQHRVRVHRHGRDDHLDEFNLQGSSQWDGLRHVRFRQHGYYGGRSEEQLDSTGVLGIERWAERGIFGRGILVDVAGFAADAGEPLDPTKTRSVDHALIAQVLASTGVKTRPGDILLVRTGWLAWYSGLTMERRQAIVADYERDRASFHIPGIDATEPSVAWFWNNRIAGIATDTPTFEVLPYDPKRGWAHHRLLALLGMPLGELWALEELARHCRQTGRYDFFLSSAPLKLPSGVATPANAYALF